MRRKKRILGALMMVTALIIMLLPVSEADAESSASDFKMSGSTLVRYVGTEKNVSIPSTVEVIGRGAFENNTNIELVVVPNTVKKIESYAFWGCDNLDTVVLGKGLTEVGDYTFTNCKGLVQMTIPSTVTSIGIQAFADCVNLKDISIPAETIDIHESAFDGCARLTIHCDTGSVAEAYAKSFYERQKEMPEYEDVPDYNNPSDGTNGAVTPSPAPEEPAVPTPEPTEEGNMLGSTQIVGNMAVVFINNTQPHVFEEEKKTEETVPVQSTEESPSDEVNPPEEGEQPEEGTSVYDIDTAIPKYTIVDGKIVADQAYYRSEDLDNMVLPDGITEIGQFSFARSSLSSVVLPTGVETIGYGAFYHCASLGDVSLPNTVMCVEPKAFIYTLWVESFLNGSDGTEGDFLTEGGVLVAYRGNSAAVTIPEGVRVIAGEAFQDHTEIESVSLPNSLLVVGEGAFEGCSNLNQISFGRNVEEIKDRAFYGNAITAISLPASVKKVGLQAFGNAVITYEGREAEYTYETSATRLSNESYRVYARSDAQEPGVTVTGLDGTFASLEGADRDYTLTIELQEDRGAMADAFARLFQTGVPEDMVIYDLTLTDASGVPLTKLGRQALSVVIPVPEALRGQELKLVTLDRNGQLEAVAAEQVTMDGVESLRFQTNHLSLYGIYGTGAPEEERVLMEINVDVNNLSAAPEKVFLLWQRPQLWFGSALFVIGLIILLTGIRKYHSR